MWSNEKWEMRDRRGLATGVHTAHCTHTNTNEEKEELRKVSQLNEMSNRINLRQNFGVWMWGHNIDNWQANNLSASYISLKWNRISDVARLFLVLCFYLCLIHTKWQQWRRWRLPTITFHLPWHSIADERCHWKANKIELKHFVIWLGIVVISASHSIK